MNTHPRIFDIHSHLNFPQFDGDREGVIKRMREEDVWTVCVGTDEKTSRECVELADSAGDGFFASVGIHPTENLENQSAADDWISGLRQLADNPKVVAIGECGLDMFRRGESDTERQEKIFEKQLELALELDKPVIVHCRDGREKALKILSPFAARGLSGDIHFFSGDWEEARKYLDMGFSISFAGPITFTDEYDEVIKKVPLNKIMAETDSPFAAPAPHRGKRNEPLFVEEVIKKIAQVRGISFEDAAEATAQNAIKMFLKT